MLSEILERHGYSQAKLARNLGRTASWVSRRLAVIDTLPDSVLQAVHRGRVGAHIAARFLVPMARANVAHCERFALAIAEHQFSVRDAQQIYLAWKRASLPVRDRISNDPKLFLRTLEATSTPNSEVVTSTLRDLSTLAAICARLHRRCANDPPEQCEIRATTKLAKLWRVARTHFNELEPYMTPEVIQCSILTPESQS